MKRPLLITDCDEVLLHMIAHFGAWLAEARGIDFTPSGGEFSNAMRRRNDGPEARRLEHAVVAPDPHPRDAGTAGELPRILGPWRRILDERLAHLGYRSPRRLDANLDA